jgi:hypothetical protein
MKRVLNLNEQKIKKEIQEKKKILKHQNVKFYNQLREYVKDNKILSQKDWEINKKNIPINFPKDPEQYFLKRGLWKGWHIFVGRRPRGIIDDFLSFKDAKNYALKLKIETAREWKKKKDFPNNIPLRPDMFYRASGDWISWGNFLGVKDEIASSKIVYASYLEAKNFAHNLKLKYKSDWNKNKYRLPNNIPKIPDVFYEFRGEWEGWEKFLNINIIKGKISSTSRNPTMKSYEEVSKYAQEKNLKNVVDWEVNKKNLPSGIPKDPRQYFTRLKQWYGWPKFFNTSYINKRIEVPYLSYKDTKEFAKKLKFNFRDEWVKNAKNLPSNIPKSPDIFYSKTNEWEDWKIFLNSDE